MLIKLTFKIINNFEYSNMATLKQDIDICINEYAKEFDLNKSENKKLLQKLDTVKKWDGFISVSEKRKELIDSILKK